MSTLIPFWMTYVFAALLGAIIGSFTNVCILRMPKGESIVRPRSHCPKCMKVLSWWENIPILSFIFLKGRCRGCGSRISFRYPLIELLCAALSVLAWWWFADPLKYILYYCLFMVPLVIASIIDLEHRILPDSITIPGIFVGVGVNILLASPGKYMSAAADSIIGLLVGGVSLFLVAFIYEKIKKQEGLGGGDVKLIAMLGAFLGWRAVIFVLLFSSILGALAGLFMIIFFKKNMKYAIPFGPFLSMTGIIHLFVGERFINWYLGLF